MSDPKKVVKKKPTKTELNPTSKFTAFLNGEYGESSDSLNETEKLELVLKLVEEVYSGKDIELKTELNERQIIAFAKGFIYAEEFDVPVVSNVIKAIEVLSVSKNRKSRKEFAKMVASLNAYPQEEEGQPKTMTKRLFG